MCFHSFTAKEHCDPGWKIAGGGLATKFPLWKLYFEDSSKKNYIELLEKDQSNKQTNQQTKGR